MPNLKYVWWRILRALIPRVRQLEEELEIERMRLAACGVAALGWFDGCKPEYESASLHDVLRLRSYIKADDIAARELANSIEEAKRWEQEHRPSIDLARFAHRNSHPG